MPQFQCKKCKYRFTPRNSAVTSPPKRCPYCGTEGVLVPTLKADELVRNVDELFEF